jgi:hypothetical protein
MPLIKHPKKRGEWVELHFMARAASHGFTISKPWGDCARFDFIVSWRKVLHRIQVKSTLKRSTSRPGYVCHTASRSGHPRQGSGRGYSAKEIDFFAFYVIPEDIWYIVPVTEVRRVRWAVYLNPQNRKSRYFRFKENWGLLKFGGRRRRPQNEML